MLATKELNYKELQTKLHELRDTGVALQVRLNSKHEVLLAEYIRLTAVEEVYTTDELPAMSKERAPSFLCKTHKVYWIDPGNGYEVDFLPYELDLWLTQHEGACCQLEVMEELEALTLSSSTSWDAPLSPQVSFGRGEEVIAIEEVAPTLEGDTIENGSMDEQEEETLRVSEDNTVRTTVLGGATLKDVEAKDLDNVPALYIAIALPIWFMVCIVMPRVSSTFKALLGAVDRYISKLGTTEQLSWFHLKYSVTAAKVLLVG